MSAERLNLTVPYAEKDAAKALGARWDAVHKVWYATDRAHYTDFRQWLPGNLIVTDSLGIVSGGMTCWRCQEVTRVSGAAVTTNQTSALTAGSLVTATGYDLYTWSWQEAVTFLPAEFIAYARQHYSIKPKYSNTEATTYLANVCEHCGALQGDFFVYDEDDALFGPFGNGSLTLETVALAAGDFAIPANCLTRQTDPATDLLSRTTIHGGNGRVTDY